jgi:hypothetical protein
MMRVQELVAAAERSERRAESTIDASLAKALLQRARQLRDMALEVELPSRLIFLRKTPPTKPSTTGPTASLPDDEVLLLNTARRRPFVAEWLCCVANLALVILGSQSNRVNTPIHARVWPRTR